MKPFLTTTWSHLAMLNYEIDPRVLEPLVPRGTELDFFDGRCFASIVGFLYRDTRIKGFAIPGHRHFAELNLRFYIRRWCDEGCRRGVAFIKEIVPRHAVTWIARGVYNENFVTRPMRHAIETDPLEPLRTSRVEYSWWEGQRWQGLTLTTKGHAEIPPQGSEAEFITEHYWGYTARQDGTTSEYLVEHPQWRIQPAAGSSFDCDVATVYGRCFAEALGSKPSSAFLAEGSKVAVYPGRRLGLKNARSHARQSVDR
jgi:uncharacterized protein YqjF (DUF2071 family)